MCELENLCLFILYYLSWLLLTYELNYRLNFEEKTRLLLEQYTDYLPRQPGLFYMK